MYIDFKRCYLCIMCIHFLAPYKTYTAIKQIRILVLKNCVYHIIRSKGKGKAIPLQAWTGPEGSRMLRLSDFKTIDT